ATLAGWRRRYQSGLRASLIARIPLVLSLSPSTLLGATLSVEGSNDALVVRQAHHERVYESVLRSPRARPRRRGGSVASWRPPRAVGAAGPASACSSARGGCSPTGPTRPRPDAGGRADAAPDTVPRLPPRDRRPSARESASPRRSRASGLAPALGAPARRGCPA